MTYSPSEEDFTAFSTANLGKGTSAPVNVIVGNFNTWEFNINDDAVMNMKLSPDIDFTKNINVHVLWICGENYAANSGEVQWQLTWSSVHDNGTESLAAPTHSGTLVSGDINIPTSANHIKHTQNFTVSAGNLSFGDSFGMTLKRIAIDSGNNPVAKPRVINVHVTYAVRKFPQMLGGN